MLQHIFEFLTDYFTNLNAKKIIGGIIVLVGLVILANVSAARTMDGMVLYALGGILVASVGSIVIYHDIAKDKEPSSYSELEILSNAQKQNQSDASKGVAWNIDQESKGEDNSAK